MLFGLSGALYETVMAPVEVVFATGIKITMISQVCPGVRLCAVQVSLVRENPAPATVGVLMLRVVELELVTTTCLDGGGLGVRATCPKSTEIGLNAILC